MKKARTKFWVVLLAVLILLGAGGGGYYYYKNQLQGERMRQAVFLNNGQVYFGYIVRQSRGNLVLKDIYYLKAQTDLNPDDKQSKISLIKLGEEMHGPADIMYINRDQVLFYEYMKIDSKINQAIERYIAAKK